MVRTRFVSALAIAALLSASTAGLALAGPVDGVPVSPRGAAPSALKDSIVRAASVAAEAPEASQFPRVPERRPAAPRRSMQGGGGGGGMMLMTLLVTAASLAGTYFLVKELKKNTDEITAGQ